MNNKKYIFCLNDVVKATQNAIKDIFGDAYGLSDLIEETIVKNLNAYTNIYRFYERNCSGCVSGNDECDFTMGRGKAEGSWEKALKGEIFDCPVRVNGTMVFDIEKRDEGPRPIDISDRDKPHYPIIEIE